MRRIGSLLVVDRLVPGALLLGRMVWPEVVMRWCQWGRPWSGVGVPRCGGVPDEVCRAEEDVVSIVEPATTPSGIDPTVLLGMVDVSMPAVPAVVDDTLAWTLMKASA